MPLMCVDKDPGEMTSFDSLVAEAQQFGQHWVLVFAAATDGNAEKSLDAMVESIKRGAIGGYVPFDVRGDTVNFG